MVFEHTTKLTIYDCDANFVKQLHHYEKPSIYIHMPSDPSFQLCFHTGNSHTGNKQYPESVLSDKQFSASPMHDTSLRAPLSKSTPLVC